ncbi:MAG: class I SAM-dependent methyltransferase [Bacillota bacterium]
MGEKGHQPEEMAAFFDARSGGYGDHMRRALGDLFDRYYAAIAAQIPAGDAPLAILDLGAGTGEEIAAILPRAPRASFTCIDLSRGMLDRLAERFAPHLEQIALIQGSYLDLPLPACRFDFAVASMTMHHFPYEVKRSLYARIRAALRPGGLYVEGDWYVGPEEEAQFLQRRASLLSQVEPGAGALYHVDIPFTLETQRRLLEQAGFSSVSVPWQEGDKAVLRAQA